MANCQTISINSRNSRKGPTYLTSKRELGIWIARFHQGVETPRSKQRGTRQGRVKVNMLGWTVLFALTSVSGMVVTLVGHAASFSLIIASFIFTTLFLLSLLARAVRIRAR